MTPPAPLPLSSVHNILPAPLPVPTVDGKSPDSALLAAQAAAQAAVAQLFLSGETAERVVDAANSDLTATMGADEAPKEQTVATDTTDVDATVSTGMSLDERLNEAAQTGAEEKLAAATEANSAAPLRWGDQSLDATVTPAQHFTCLHTPGLSTVPHSVGIGSEGRSVGEAVMAHNAAILPDPQYRSESRAGYGEPSRYPHLNREKEPVLILWSACCDAGPVKWVDQRASCLDRNSHPIQ